MASNDVDDKTWKLLLERDNFQCLNCNSENDLAPAHYKSRGSGGESNLENLMLLCFFCHHKHHTGKLKIKLIDGHFYFREVK